jgi:hypothetical protein
MTLGRAHLDKMSVRAIVTVLVGIGLLSYWAMQISESPVTSDASHNLQMAINFSHHGIMSLDQEPPYHPTMYREPVPALTTALAISASDMFQGRADRETYFSGSRAQTIKYQNLLWLFLLTASAFYIVHWYSSSFYFSLVGAVLVNVPIPLIASGPDALGIDTFATELPAAALLLAGSGLIAFSIRNGSIAFTVLAGVFFAALALTKAAFFYIFIVFAIIFLAFGTISRIRLESNGRLIQAVVLVAVFALTVSPWMLRNKIHLGSFAIAERGGVVLYTHVGAIYYWAPYAIKPIVGRIMGLSSADAELGGSLQRLNRKKDAFGGSDLLAELEGRPEDVISYYRKARAERVRLRMSFEASGVDLPNTAADRALQEKAFEIILDQPMRHLNMSLLFLWRGGFLISLLLLSVVAYGVKARRFDLVALSLSAGGFVAFYALLSHFIPRYAVPLAPITVVSAMALVSIYWHGIHGRHRLPKRDAS